MAEGQEFVEPIVHKTMKEVGKGLGRMIIRIVSWGDHEPVLEKRQVILDHTTGKERMGKCKGLRVNEFMELVEKKDEVVRTMREAGGQ